MRGQRLYVMVQDAGDMKRAGEVLSARLWLSAHGRVQVSASGQLLVRSLFDQAMFQPARLDFIGGAVCEAPLEQRRGSPVSVCGRGWLDTKSALRDLNADEQQRYDTLVAKAKADKQQDADKAKGVWTSERLGTATATLIKNGVQPQEARRCAEKTLQKALKGVLSGDFLIQLEDGTTLSVAAALKEPDRWDGALTLDPLEPDYDGGRIVGKLYLHNANPCLYSFAHGGSRYFLHRQPVSMLCQPGQHAPLVQQLTDFLIGETDIFVHGKDLVQLVDDKLMLLDEHSICLLAGNRVTLFKLDKNGIQLPADLPVAVARMILSALQSFKFRKLQALITLPCTTSEGRVLDRTGYDSETGLYLQLPSTWVACSNAPITRVDLIDAVKKLWAPWSQYRFATECDRGAMLAAVLTAVNRPVLDKCPGFAIDAPVPACGKTLLAEALNCLICGRHGSGMVAHKKDQQADVELQKQLMTLTRHGISVLLLDNVDAYLDSATLASLLTSGSISGRLLNTNDWFAADHRLFFTMTSNNASLSRDLSQRMVRVRIDPQTENPQARRFAFSPSDLALSMRADIAAAVLFLMRAYTEAGMPQLSSDDARFPQWSKLIRNAVLWLQQEGLGVAAGIGALGDPADSIVHQKTQNDPKTMVLAELLNALHERFGVHPFLARDIVAICNGAPDQMDPTQQVIYESMLELSPQKLPFTAFTISAGLRNLRDKISNGRKLMATINRTGTMNFTIALCP